MSKDADAVSGTLNRINESWVSGKLDPLATLFHDDIVVVYPGHTQRTRGRAAAVDGFREFTQASTLIEFKESDRHVDIVGDVAVASFAFSIRYERDGAAYDANGRDLWVFHRAERGWVAVWRTMLHMQERPVDQ